MAAVMKHFSAPGQLDRRNFYNHRDSSEETQLGRKILKRSTGKSTLRIRLELSYTTALALNTRLRLASTGRFKTNSIKLNFSEENLRHEEPTHPGWCCTANLYKLSLIKGLVAFQRGILAPKKIKWNLKLIQENKRVFKVGFCSLFEDWDVWNQEWQAVSKLNLLNFGYSPFFYLKIHQFCRQCPLLFAFNFAFVLLFRESCNFVFIRC